MASAPGAAVVIPARLESTRLPRKLLQTIAGRTVLEWTYSRARAARGLQGVWIATDSDEISATAQAFGAAVVRTGPHASGTDRVAAAAAAIRPAPRWVINVQGDEPLLDPRAIEGVAAALREEPEAIVTCAAPLAAYEDWLDPAVVKVVVNAQGRALYFSRAPIPGAPGGATAESFARIRPLVRHHIGIYGYSLALLQRFAALPPAALERAESLEQLRALEAGIAVRVLVLEGAAVAVDTPADLARVRGLIEESSPQ